MAQLMADAIRAAYDYPGTFADALGPRDIYRARGGDIAEANLRHRAASDLGDWFRFEIGSGRTNADGAIRTPLPVTAKVGEAAWAQFRLDLVGIDLRMTGEPEDVPTLARPNIGQHACRTYPLVDQFARNVAAIFERNDARNTPSTLFKDLVDLIAIVTRASVDGPREIMLPFIDPLLGCRPSRAMRSHTPRMERRRIQGRTSSLKSSSMRPHIRHRSFRVPHLLTDARRQLSAHIHPRKLLPGQCER